MGVNPSLCYRQTNLGRCDVLKIGGPRTWNMKSSKIRGELNVLIFLSKKGAQVHTPSSAGLELYQNQAQVTVR